jgi:predicted dehydrogenase
MTRRFKAAIMGAGAMGSIMARDIYPRLHETVEVVAIIDRHADRGQPLADLHGARLFPSIESAVHEVPIDGLDIRVQHVGHAPAVLSALSAGLHVLVEKPLATSLDECESLLHAQQKSGLVVAVAENYPHLKSTRAAQRAIREGSIGEVLSVRTTRAYTLDGVWATTSWRQGSGDDAGILWDQGTHHTSLLRHLVGEVEAVSAHRSADLRTPGSEVVALTLRLASGTVAQALYCWGAPRRAVETEATVRGTSGSVSIGVSYDEAAGHAQLEGADGATPLSQPENYYDSHGWIVQDWVSAIEEGRQPLVDLASATQDVRVVLAAKESLARNGALVSIHEVGAR